MNANELADALVNTDYTQLKAECATMLRQQQEKLTKYELRNEEQRNRIAHLEAEIERLLETQEYLYKVHDADKAEIEALKHQVTGLKLSWQCETDIVEKQQALIEEQDKKIIELAFRAVYAERSNEVVKELSK